MVKVVFAFFTGSLRSICELIVEVESVESVESSLTDLYKEPTSGDTTHYAVDAHRSSG